MDLLEEKYPKGKYIPLDAEERKEAQQNLYDLISNAYSSIGGHVKFQSPSDIVDPESDYWRAADLDDDPELDVGFLNWEEALISRFLTLSLLPSCPIPENFLPMLAYLPK